jgi:hypothetical protein
MVDFVVGARTRLQDLAGEEERRPLLAGVPDSFSLKVCWPTPGHGADRSLTLCVELNMEALTRVRR